MSWVRVTEQLAFTAPLFPDNLFGHLAATGVPGVEEWRDGAYRRTMLLEHGPAIVAVSPRADHVRCELALSSRGDLDQARARCRWLLDLDADPMAVGKALTQDPVLGPLVTRTPGRRVPHTVDSAELAVRAVLGQQVSTAAARTHAARLVQAHGTPIDDPDGGLTHLFPTPRQLTALDPEALAFPKARRRTLIGLVAALADGDVLLDADWSTARERLLALPGIGPWTVDTIAMRAIGDPDVFLGSDLGMRAAAKILGLPLTASGLTAYAEIWRPYRAYAVQYLWATGQHAVNRLPPD